MTQPAVLQALTAAAYRDADTLAKQLNGDRIDLIRRARRAGVTLEEIARAAGVSRQRIYQLTERPDG